MEHSRDGEGRNCVEAMSLVPVLRLSVSVHGASVWSSQLGRLFCCDSCSSAPVGGAKTCVLGTAPSARGPEERR